MREGSLFFEWTHRRLGGADFPATVLITRMEMAGQAFIEATVRDITAQKQAEERIEKTLVRQLRRQPSFSTRSWPRPRWRTNSERLPTPSSACSTPISVASG